MTETSWSLMTKSRGGTVSVLRDLTEEQCRKAYERLDPWYGYHSTQYSTHPDHLPPGEYSTTMTSGGRVCEDGDIEVREVFGPPGWKMEGWGGQWPKVTTIWCDAKMKPLDPQPTPPE